MRSWWCEKDYSDVLNEHCITVEKGVKSIVQDICEAVSYSC